MVCEFLLLLNFSKERFSILHFPLNEALKCSAAPLNLEYEHSLPDGNQEL